jgi:hypothetical protein
MPEALEALISLELIQQFANAWPTLVVSSFRHLAQEGLELGEDLLDRIQSGTVGPDPYISSFEPILRP